MPNVRGLVSSADLEAGIRKLDVRDFIFELEPEEAPFVSIMKKLSKNSCQDTEFHWFEDDLLGNYTQLNMAGNAAAGVVSLIVDDASIFQVNDVIKNVTTLECILITGVDDGSNTLTVKRGWGTTAAVQIDDDEYLYKLGSAQKEGYDSPESLITQKVKRSNYLQIFSKTVEITKTAAGIATYGGNRRDFERRKKGVELKRDMEAQFLFGEPKEDVTGAKPQRQTGGIYYFIALGGAGATLDMATSALTESAFEGWLKDLFLYGSSERFIFGGPLFLSSVSQFATPKQRLEPGVETKYGIKVTRYVSAMGTVNLVLDKHFTGPYAGKALGLDVKNIIYRYLNGQDLTLRMDVQDKKSHYFMDEYEGTVGLEMHLSKLHGTVTGMV